MTTNTDNALASEEILRQAATTVLQAWCLEHTTDYFLGSADGLALLALLCNATAKSEPSLYNHKLPLIQAAFQHADPASWWVDSHQHGTYGNVVIIMQTAFGQMAFHIRTETNEITPEWLTDAPKANGRQWAGVPIQHRAIDLTLEWLAQRKALFYRTDPVKTHGPAVITIPLAGPYGQEDATIVSISALLVIQAFQQLSGNLDTAVDAWLLTADAQRHLLCI